MSAAATVSSGSAMKSHHFVLLKACYFLLYLVVVTNSVFVAEAFFVGSWSSTPFHKTTRTSLLLAASRSDKQDDNDEDTDEMDTNLPFSSDILAPKIKSNMPGYMASFLERNHRDESLSEEQPRRPDDYFTHLIGFPLEECHELLLQLESVQRAVLYHCPSLIRAAIVPVMTRLPLLYVDARSAGDATAATQALTKVVKRVVQQHLKVKVKDWDSSENDNVIIDDELEFMRGPNEQGHKPLVLTFEKLEMDGLDNEVLLTTVKEEDPNLEILRRFQKQLIKEVEALGFQTALPPDPHASDEKTTTTTKWRPRVPFMRLPDKFEENLPDLPEGQAYRKPEEGGNGISPIFFCEWWDDVFSENTRLSSVGVYARQLGISGNGVCEKTFYHAHETVTLPSGNAALTKDEERHAQYQESRHKEAEKQLDGKVNEDDIPDPSLKEARTKLESLYKTSLENVNLDNVGDDGLVAQIPVDDPILMKDDDIEEEEEEEEDGISSASTISSPDAAITNNNNNNDAALDDWMKERIRKVVEGRDSVKAKEAVLTPKTTPPPIPYEENPVFQKYHQEHQREKEDAKANNKKEKDEKDDLPPFPSREHFIGPWNVLSSPIPSEQSLNSNNSNEDDTKSDNIILRVDGTTFGGPVLDREFMHKAAGGTWKFLEEEEMTRLRIRLVVPPSKERILCLEGQVTRLLMPSSNLQTTRNTFGIPMLEEAAQAKQEAEESFYENQLQCDGKMWLEDAVTGANRKDLGDFTLMKVENQNPKDYVVTIPRSVRIQD